MLQTGRCLYGFYFCFELIFHLIFQEADFSKATQVNIQQLPDYRLGRSPANPITPSFPELTPRTRTVTNP